jgi:hypothetical protein
MVGRPLGEIAGTISHLVAKSKQKPEICQGVLMLARQLFLSVAALRIIMHIDKCPEGKGKEQP